MSKQSETDPRTKGKTKQLGENKRTPRPLVPFGDEGVMLTVRDLMRRLNVPRSWVYEAAARGELPSLKLGKYLRFRQDELERYLEEKREAARMEREARRGTTAQSA